MGSYTEYRPENTTESSGDEEGMSQEAKLIQLLQEQLEFMKSERQEERQRHQEERLEERQRHQEERQRHEEERKMFLQALKDSSKENKGDTAKLKGKTECTNFPSIPSFQAFDSTSELWSDYWTRFTAFIGAHSIPEAKMASVFLTNQSPTIFKLLSNLASQKSPAKNVNDLTFNEIGEYMKDQFDPKRFVIRERFNFWSSMRRKPGETIQELAAQIRQDAVTCDFPSIRDPQDEAMRTRFICSVNNEAILKSLFKYKDDELTFSKAIQIGIETEEAAKVAKETVYGPNQNQSDRLQ